MPCCWHTNIWNTTGHFEKGKIAYIDSSVIFPPRSTETKSNRIVRQCTCKKSVGKEQCCRASFNKQADGRWKCTLLERKLCTGVPQKSRAAGTSAYTKDQLQTQLGHLGPDIRPRLVEATLAQYLQRARSFSTSTSSTLTYLVKMDSRGGAPGEVLKRLPAMAAAFRAKGWYVQLIIEDAETMHEIIS